MKNVMIIIDESNSSYDLLLWVLANLKDTIESSKVSIFAKQPQTSFTSTTLSSPLGFAQIFYPFSANVELIKLAHKKNNIVALGILEKAKQICLNHGIKAETFTDIGDPNVVVRKIIQDEKVDLVVMSYQQTHDLQKCVHNTDCSLLVVKERFHEVTKH